MAAAPQRFKAKAWTWAIKLSVLLPLGLLVLSYQNCSSKKFERPFSNLSLPSLGSPLPSVGEPPEDSNIGYWLLNGSTMTAHGALTPFIAPVGQRIVGAGDFNGDSKPDLIFEDDITLQLNIWLMNGTSQLSAITVKDTSGNTVSIPLGWRVVGVGDFNSDSKPDLVWENDTTLQLAVWLMNGAIKTGNVLISDTAGAPITIPLGWKVTGVGDFNADGKTDLIWENDTTLQLAFWLMNGTRQTATGIIADNSGMGTVFPINWKVVGVGDFNSDGKPDLIWANEKIRQLAIWFMNGVVKSGSILISDPSGVPVIIPQMWIPVGVNDLNSDGKPDLIWEVNPFQYYVSPQGNDSFLGTPTRPFKSIGKAQSMVQHFNSNMPTDITVNLMGGLYEINNTLTFLAGDSATNGHRIFYQAPPGEKPVISGGLKLTGLWTPTLGKPSVWQTSLPTGFKKFRQLYVDNARATQARAPNISSPLHPEGSSNYYVLDITSGDFSTRTFKNLPAANLQNWNNLNQVEMVVFETWASNNLRISSLQKATDNSWTLTPQEPERTNYFADPSAGLAPNWRQAFFYVPNYQGYIHYYFQNALELLDSPGEWYADQSAGILYYMPAPGTNPNGHEFIIPQSQYLVSVTGAQNISFSGLTFTYSNWNLANQYGFTSNTCTDSYPSYPTGSLLIQGTNGIQFIRNIFQHLGGAAIDFKAQTNSEIIGNAFYDVSGSGIIFSTASTSPVVKNNIFKHLGLDYYVSAAVCDGATTNGLFSHNDVSGLPGIGLEVQGTGNVIANNHIYNVTNINTDSGGYYGNPAGNTQVIGNYIHDLPAQLGIYFDYWTTNTSSIMVKDNVLFDPSKPNNPHAKIICNETNPSLVGCGQMVRVNNESASPITINNAGLEPAYQDLKSLVP